MKRTTLKGWTWPGYCKFDALKEDYSQSGVFPSLILSLLPSLSASALPPLTNFLSNFLSLLLGVLLTRLAQ